MKVPGDSPPSRHKKKTGFLFAGCSVVSCFDSGWPSPPDFAVSLRLASELLVSVCVVVDEDGQDSQCEDGEGEGEAELVGVTGEIERVACVDGGHPH